LEKTAEAGTNTTCGTLTMLKLVQKHSREVK
jgi:hypothetical protein